MRTCHIYRYRTHEQPWIEISESFSKRYRKILHHFFSTFVFLLLNWLREASRTKLMIAVFIHASLVHHNRFITVSYSIYFYSFLLYIIDLFLSVIYGRLFLFLFFSHIFPERPRLENNLNYLFYVQ